MTLGDYLRDVRHEKRITQDALARRIGLSQSALAYIENGRAMPRLDTILRLGGALGIELSVMFGATRKILRRTHSGIVVADRPGTSPTE